MGNELIRKHRRIRLYLYQVDRFGVRRSDIKHYDRYLLLAALLVLSVEESLRTCQSQLVFNTAHGHLLTYARSTLERTKSTESRFICRIVTCGPCPTAKVPASAIQNLENTS